VPDAALRSAGLSAAKAASIRDLAVRVDAGEVKLARMSRLPDDEIVRELTLVRGIGRWTAEMFLMFQLGRPDVWPVDDLGVRKGYSLIYGLPEMPIARDLDPLGERFRPYRSVVAWYCWRAVDTVVPG
jgi:DNA-3-methyladenine glycosylase II